MNNNDDVYDADAVENSASIPARCRQAARVNRKSESTIRLYIAICQALAENPMTAEQCAAQLGRSRAAVQPRISELANEYCLIRPTGGKRRNASSGKYAAVWTYNFVPGQIDTLRRRLEKPTEPENRGSFFDD